MKSQLIIVFVTESSKLDRMEYAKKIASSMGYNTNQPKSDGDIIGIHQDIANGITRVTYEKQ